MSSEEKAMVAVIEEALFCHRWVVLDEGPQCACGWFATPLLTSMHRRHQAASVLAATLMATAQIHAENIAESRARLTADWQTRYMALQEQLAQCRDHLLTS